MTVSLTVDVKLSKKHIGAEEGDGFVQDVRILSWILCSTKKDGVTTEGV